MTDRYRFGLLNPVNKDIKTYRDDDPTIETALDRLQKLIKPKSDIESNISIFIGEVVDVLSTKTVDDLSPGQRATMLIDPKSKSIYQFVVRIPESFSAAIPEPASVGKSAKVKKDKLSLIYKNLLNETTFVLENPDIPLPARGDLVKCAYIDTENSTEGGIIYDIVGKQGERTGGIITESTTGSPKNSFDSSSGSKKTVEDMKK